MQTLTQRALSKFPGGNGSHGYVVLPTPNGGLQNGTLMRHEAVSPVTHDKVDEYFRAIYYFCGLGYPGPNPFMADALNYTFKMIWRMLLQCRPPPELVYIESFDVILGTPCSLMYPFDAVVLINAQFYTWIGDPRTPLTSQEVKMLPRYKINFRDIVTDMSCRFCLELFQLNQCAIQLPCGHFFHRKCITIWLTRKWECPCCKFLVRKNGLLEPGRGLIPYGFPQGGVVPVNTAHFTNAASIAHYAKNQLSIALGPNNYLQMAKTHINPIFIMTQPAR